MTDVKIHEYSVLPRGLRERMPAADRPGQRDAGENSDRESPAIALKYQIRIDGTARH
jgi:hypothetical protein